MTKPSRQLPRCHTCRCWHQRRFALEDAIEYGRDLIPLVRAAVAERDTAQGLPGAFPLDAISLLHQ
jgi:hypothetical protein